MQQRSLIQADSEAAVEHPASRERQLPSSKEVCALLYQSGQIMLE